MIMDEITWGREGEGMFLGSIITSDYFGVGGGKVRVCY